FFRNHAQAIGGAVATWPLAARAQQAAMPVIGFLRSAQLVDATHLVTAFSQGLNDRHLCSCGLGGDCCNERDYRDLGNILSQSTPTGSVTNGRGRRRWTAAR